MHDVATIVLSIAMLVMVLALVGLIATGRIRGFRLSLKNLSLETLGGQPEKDLKQAMADITTPAAASTYSTLGDSIVKAAQVPQRLDILTVDLIRQPLWLDSRRFFMVVLLERMRQLRCVLFVESNEDGITRFVGLATPSSVRWSLARLHPWLEEAFASAYASLGTQDPSLRCYRPQSLTGALSVDVIKPILRSYLEKVQQNQAPEHNRNEWTLLPDSPTWEHATYLTRADLEHLLGEDLKRPAIPHNLKEEEKLAAILLQTGDFVAVVNLEQLVETVDRRKWVEATAHYVGVGLTQGRLR